MNWYSKASEVLNNDGILLCPTDTIWGLSANALQAASAKKINKIKQRPKSKSFIVLVSGFDMLKQYVYEIPDYIFTFLKQTQNPTTVIYPRGKFPKEVLADDGSIGIRIPKKPWLANFIDFFGKPIISTSANRSGETNPQSFGNISNIIKEQVDYIVPYGKKYSENRASSIVKFENGALIVIRK